jgi:voltage-gated potassium channel
MRRYNFVYLLIGLLVLLLAAPVAVEYLEHIDNLIIQVATSATIVFGIWSLLEAKTWFRIVLLLALIELISTGLAVALDLPALKYVDFGILLAFYVISIGIATRHILFEGPIDFNKITGAMCIYLLLGLSWALLYAFLNRVVPGSFSGMRYTVLELQVWEFVYTSFVTLTTLGYGDISPMTPIARSLAYMEAIVGQFYLAVLVASLVGTYIADRHDARANRPTPTDSQSCQP